MKTFPSTLSRLAVRALFVAAWGLPLALPLAPPPALAQAAAAPVIGVVDGVKINDSFTKLKGALEEIEKRKNTLRTQLDARVFLPEAQTKRFDELIVKATRSEAENTELATLVKAGSDRRTEYNGLIAKAQKAEADSARIKAIEEETQRTSTSFQAVLDKVDKAVTEQEVQTEDSYRAQIIKAVEEVATARKLVVVVGKQAVAWNSQTIEITDEVIARLNKA
jgi:Skp family chaperone for outer membrane proteins